MCPLIYRLRPVTFLPGATKSAPGLGNTNYLLLLIPIPILILILIPILILRTIHFFLVF
jgi:hypothetical protein